MVGALDVAVVVNIIARKAGVDHDVARLMISLLAGKLSVVLFRVP